MKYKLVYAKDVLALRGVVESLGTVTICSTGIVISGLIKYPRPKVSTRTKRQIKVMASVVSNSLV